MQEVFERLAPEYATLIAQAKILPAREHEVAEVAERLLRDKETYSEVAEQTGVPIAVLMALSEREMSGNLHCYLGNGQALNHRTTIVPIGRGPFLQPFPQNFVAGCLDGLHLDGLDKIAEAPDGWSWPRIAYEAESWNGWGYRAHGIPSPYVFGATTVQRPGKYVRDHDFELVTDPQLGVVAIIEALVAQDPSLGFSNVAPAPVEDSTPVVVAPHPVIGNSNVAWVQKSLNRLRGHGTPIDVDGNYGRHTARAVMWFQSTHHLVVDGLAGHMTIAALQQALAEDGMS